MADRDGDRDVRRPWAPPAAAPCHRMRQLTATEGISSREEEVLAWLANGADDRTIAQQLRVSHRTVRAHISALFVKLQAANRTELALLGLLAHLRDCTECLDGLAPCYSERRGGRVT